MPYFLCVSRSRRIAVRTRSLKERSLDTTQVLMYITKYRRMYMNQQFVSVTEARAKLKELVDLVVAGKTRIVLVRESKPQVAMVRYDDMAVQEEESEKEWQRRFKKALDAGRAYGRRWAKRQGIDLKNVTEEELYEIIDKATGRG